MMRHSDNVYLAINMFEGDEGELRLHTAKIVVAAKQHECTFTRDDTHRISIGERHRVDKALVDGDFFSTYRSCETCMNRHILDFGIFEGIE